MNIKNNSQKKTWRKPGFITVKKSELKEHIQAAARSGSQCPGRGR